MDFLKAIYGDKALTFDEFAQAINAHNGNEANKDKLIKLANLGGGEYVSKAKHDALVAERDGARAELNTANGLIAELKKASKGNEDFQTKITGYETQVADLQTQLQETKIKSALKVGLLSEQCDDIDYVTFVIEKKLKDQGKTLELDDNDNIKGWDDILSGVKTQLPAHFTGSNDPVIEPNPLPKPNPGDSGLTKEEFNKMGYNSRVKLKEENPELYANMMKG